MSFLTECPQGSASSRIQSALRDFSAACCAWKHAWAYCPFFSRMRALARSSSAVDSHRPASLRFFSSLINRHAFSENAFDKRPTRNRQQFFRSIDQKIDSPAFHDFMDFIKFIEPGEKS